MIKQKIVRIISLLALVALPFQVFAQVDPGFDPNKIVDDKVFGDIQTFGGPEGIQKFLENKHSVLANTSPDFLVKLKEPSVTMLKTALEDPEPNLGRLRTAAELIWDASRQSNINPQVILVTLNKEQGLITAKTDPNDPSIQRSLDFSMGFACPDSGGCSNLFPGFYFQLFGNIDSDGNRYLGAAKSLMKSFSTPGGRGPVVNGSVAHVGDTVSIDNTTGDPYNAAPSQMVTISNNATAALYRYTPHVFNGNYNFWKYFNEWFRYPNGTLVKLSNDVATYIIQNGSRQMVPQFVAAARGINLSNTVTISPSEADNYPVDKVYGPVDNTIVKSTTDGKTYVFINNIKHPASEFVISQRGLNPATAVAISDSELNLFDPGNVLPPKDGTVIRGKVNPPIYLVDQGKIKMFSPFTFAQRKVAKQVVTVPDEEIPTYEKAGFVAPLDGTLVKAEGTQTVFLIQNGLKQAVTGDIFKNRGFKAKDVAVLSADEVNGLVGGAYAQPKDYTFFTAAGSDGQVYEFKEGATHPISTFVAKQRGITPDYTFTQDMMISWTLGIPVPPKDNTVIKGDSDQTIYLVQKGQLRPLTYNAFKKRKITAKQIKTLTQSEVDSYAKGDTLDK